VLFSEEWSGPERSSLVRLPAVRNQSGDMTPQMMVLCATIAGPGTFSEVQKRLVAMWPAADFDSNAAHGNLPSLAEKGLLEIVERGERKAEDLYAINDKGWAHIRKWVASWPPDPALREPIPAKTSLARLDQLPLLIEMDRAQAERCRAASDAAQAKLLSEERLREKRPPRNPSEEFNAAIRVAQLKHETLAWGDIAAQLDNHADDLEMILEQFSERQAGGEGV
jgi:DNA-binding PadR family transcriptional regulator